MRVALDVENVLANPNEPALQATDKLSREVVEDTWFSNAESERQFQVFMGVTDAIWRHNPQSIPPEEPNLDKYVADIHEAADELVILTHREHVDEQIIWWLEEHNIVYDDYISTDLPKWEFDFDVWVDDNPNMIGKCRTLMRYQKWNANIGVEESKFCDHIYSLAEVVDFIDG